MERIKQKFDKKNSIQQNLCEGVPAIPVTHALTSSRKRPQ